MNGTSSVEVLKNVVGYNILASGKDLRYHIH